MLPLLNCFSEKAADTRGEAHGRGCCGETAGETVTKKYCTAAGGLQPLEDPLQSRRAVGSKDKWKKIGRKQGMEEINHYALTPTSYATQHLTEGVGRDGE